MNEEEMLKKCWTKGFLNEKGLNKLVGYLSGQIVDYEQRIIKQLDTEEYRKVKEKRTETK